MYKFKINGKSYEAEVIKEENGIVEIELNGKLYSVEVEQDERVVPPPPPANLAIVPPSTPVITAPKVVERAPSIGGGANDVKSPLPGVVLEVKVGVGDTVKKGDVVMVLEAMKMENNIEALSDGVVSRIVKQKGESVMEGDSLIVLE